MTLSDEPIKAREEILNIFDADTSEEAIQRLAILVEKRHTLPTNLIGIYIRKKSELRVSYWNIL
jgi:hypothetical protein